MLCHLEVTRPQRQPVFREARNVKGINRDDFRKVVAAMVDTQPELTALRLNEELRSLLDKLAPAARRTVPAGWSFPWSASVSGELRSAKRQRRRAERKWLKTGLTVDKQIYSAAKKELLQTLFTRQRQTTSLLR